MYTYISYFNHKNTNSKEQASAISFSKPIYNEPLEVKFKCYNFFVFLVKLKSDEVCERWTSVIVMIMTIESVLNIYVCFLSGRTSISAHSSTNSPSTRPGTFWLRPSSTAKTWWLWSWLWTRPQDHISLLRMRTWVPTAPAPTHQYFKLRLQLWKTTATRRWWERESHTRFHHVGLTPKRLLSLIFRTGRSSRSLQVGVCSVYVRSLILIRSKVSFKMEISLRWWSALWTWIWSRLLTNTM